MKLCAISVTLVLTLAVGSAAYAQVPEDVAKSSADLAVRQAEAIERARLKVAQEAEAEQAKRRAEQQQRDRELERVMPLDVQVTITRLLADKKVSSFPYQLSVNALHQHKSGPAPVTQLRMGARVAMPTMAAPTVDGKPVPGMLQPNPVQYEDIGTSIDSSARFLDDGGFDVFVTVEDTSVYTPPRADTQASPIEALPVVRTFRSSNHVVLKDGQTKQFTLAADRVSGETLRVDVTLRVAK